jgi:YD repeat-containing protein
MKKYSYLFILSMLLLICCKDLEELIHPPVAKEATDVCSEGFTANWESKFDCKKFLLYVSEEADFDSYLPGYEGKEVEGNSHHVDGLEPEHTYYYKVRAKLHDKLSDYSNVIEVKTSDYCLSAPVALECKDLEYDRFTARWEAVDGAEKYVLEVAYDKDFKNYVEGYERRVTTDLHKPVYILDENTTYYYRVRAVKEKTWSRYSNVVECKTPLHQFLLKKIVIEHNGIPIWTLTAEYNDKYQVSKVSRTYEDRSAGINYHYIYDNKGRLIRMESEQSGNIGQIYEFTYDDQGRVIKAQETVSDLETITYSYDATGNNFSTQGNRFGLDKNYKRDKYGKIVFMGLNSHQYQSIEHRFTYDDKKAPKGLNYMLHSLGPVTDNEYLETFFPVWNKQTKLVKKMRRDWIINDSCSLGERYYIYKHTFNEHGLPVHRRIFIQYGDNHPEKGYHEMHFYYEETPEENTLQ